MATTVFERARPSAEAVAASLAGTRLGVYWLESLAERPSHPRLAGDESADLAIVGGGYAGLWTAIRAKERDPERDVVLLEAARIGWAASGRNGGFAEASLTHGYDNGLSRWPDEMETLERLGLENLDDIERAVERYGMDVDWERTGAISVAVEPHQVEWVRDEGGEYLDEEAMRASIASPTYLAGAKDPDATAIVHPGKLAVELARVATELGVRIFEGTRVSQIEGRDPEVTLRTATGSVRAQRVALATNGFPSLLKRFALHTVPVYDYVLMTEPLTDAQLASVGWEGREGVADLANQFHYYRLTADNRILWGGYDAIYHRGGRIRAEYEDRIETHEKLAAHFLTTFPQLEGIRFTHRWAGVIDTSSRFCAFFGRARGGAVSYAAGFTGLGVAATRFAADVMLDQLDGEDTERTRLKMVREIPIPFPPEPLADPVINVTRRSLDKADHAGGRRDLLLRTMHAVGLGFDS